MHRITGVPDEACDHATLYCVRITSVDGEHNRPVYQAPVWRGTSSRVLRVSVHVFVGVHVCV